MSDVLMMWALQEHWGGPLKKLAAVFVAERTIGLVADGVTDEALSIWSGMSIRHARSTLRDMVDERALVLAVGPRGPGYAIGRLWRGERLVLRFPDCS